jgi:hypothetical protein
MALEPVQAQAGHASIESTRIYLHRPMTGWRINTGPRPRRSTRNCSPITHRRRRRERLTAVRQLG